jgi:hypothetical protein
VGVSLQDDLAGGTVVGKDVLDIERSYVGSG